MEAPEQHTGGVAAALDTASVPPWERRNRLLQQFDALGEGGRLRITGGREVETLHRMLSSERAGLFHWVWAERGPDRWTAYVERLPVGSLYTLGRGVT